MVALIDDYDSFPPAMPRLEQLGWCAAPEPRDRDQRKWSVCFPTIERRTHHLHVVERTFPGWQDWVLFRDYLRANTGAATRYEILKRRLASADRNDRARYRAAKAPLITELTGEARKWRNLYR